MPKFQLAVLGEKIRDLGGLRFVDALVVAETQRTNGLALAEFCDLCFQLVDPIFKTNSHLSIPPYLGRVPRPAAPTVRRLDTSPRCFAVSRPTSSTSV